MSQNSFTQRTITKTNFLLQKFGGNPKKYPKWNLYKRWVKERNPPPLPFELNETLRQGASALYIGGLVLQIRTSKRLKTSNHYGVLELKEFMKKMLATTDVSLDDLASFIAVYSLNLPAQQQGTELVNQKGKEEKIIEKEDKKIGKKETILGKEETILGKEEKKEEENQITIQLDNDDIDDWENIQF